MHEALGAVRVMRTCGSEGEVIGMAASVCVQKQTDPRGVYEKHLPALQEIMRKGVGKIDGSKLPYDNSGERARAHSSVPPPEMVAPAWLKDAGDNLARTATLSVPGAVATRVRNELLLNDRKGDVTDNAMRWVSQDPLPHHIEFTWPAPITLGAARVISGFYAGNAVSVSVSDFAFEYHDGQSWRAIPSAQATGNTAPAWAALFKPTQTKRLRLTISKTPGGASRVWEVELYAPVKAANAP